MVFFCPIFYINEINDLKSSNLFCFPSTSCILIKLSKFQVFGYARKLAKLGVGGVLVDSLREGLSSPCLISASIALKAVAVNVSFYVSRKIDAAESCARLLMYRLSKGEKFLLTQ